MTGTAWVASLSPWPEEFGLERMQRLLADLGDPQRSVPGRPRRRDERQVDDDADDRGPCCVGEGLRVGAYTSPHVSGWHERLDTDPAGFERAVTRVRSAAERAGATQFEALTAAALAEFAADGVDAAVVEAGLGGRLDATNVLRAPVVVLTNVGLEHTEQLGETREEIAAEKLAVVRAGRRRSCSASRSGRRLPARRARRRRCSPGTATSRSPSPRPRRSSAAPSIRRRPRA